MAAIPERNLPVLGIHQVIRLLDQRGIDTDRLLREAGISPGLLEDPTATVTRGQELRLIATIQGKHPDPCFGLKAGCCYRLSAFGALGSAMFAAQNANEAILFFIRFIRLSYTYFQVKLTRERDRTRIVLGDQYDLGDLHPYFVQRDLAFAVTGARDVIPSVLSEADLQIDVALPEPADQTPYTELFRCPVRFGCEETAISFRNRILERPLPQANALSMRMLEQQCEKDLKRLSPAPKLEETLLALFGRMDGYPDEADVASRLSITTRTLRRRLSREGISYQRLVDRHLSLRAKALLDNTSLPVARIAEHLGYSEAASFIRAFKRWHSISPAAFRKRR